MVTEHSCRCVSFGFSKSDLWIVFLLGIKLNSDTSTIVVVSLVFVPLLLAKPEFVSFWKRKLRFFFNLRRFGYIFRNVWSWTNQIFFFTTSLLFWRSKGIYRLLRSVYIYIGIILRSWCSFKTFRLSLKTIFNSKSYLLILRSSYFIWLYRVELII